MVRMTLLILPGFTAFATPRTAPVGVVYHPRNIILCAADRNFNQTVGVTRLKMSPDTLVAAKNVYKFLDENPRVRVLEVVFQPGDVAKMHHHPDHMIYALKGGKLKIMTSNGKSNTINVELGGVVFGCPGS
jgi:hypothetical protein